MSAVEPAPLNAGHEILHTYGMLAKRPLCIATDITFLRNLKKEAAFVKPGRYPQRNAMHKA